MAIGGCVGVAFYLQKLSRTVLALLCLVSVTRAGKGA